MAQQKSDRDDLLRDATALVERVELALTGPEEWAGNVVVGFRRDGAASFFFGADPVYQFNAKGELRRAYCNDLLLKAVNGRLASLRRVREGREVQLLRHDLTDDEEGVFLAEMVARLEHLAAALNAGNCEIVGQAPEEVDVVSRLKVWLSGCKTAIVAAAPNLS